MTRPLFGSLCALVFLVNFGRVMFAPLVEPLRAQFGVGPAAIGVVTTLVWVGSALPRIPVGYLLTKVARRYVVIGSGTLLVAAATFTALADSLLALRVGALGIGLASGAYFVAAIPLVGELFPEGRGRALGVHGTFAQVAAVAAPGVAVAVLVAVSWRAAFLLLAGTAAAVTATLVVVLRTRESAVDGAGAAAQDFRAALAEWRVVLAGIVLVGGIGFAWQGVFNFYVTYVTSAKGFDPGTANQLLTLAFAAGVPAFWVSGRLVDRFPHVPYALALNGVFVAGLAALTVAESLPTVAFATVLVGYAIHAMFPAADTYVLETLAPSTRASAYAVFSGLALLFEAQGSGVVGALTGAGLEFDAVFRGFAAALAALALLLATLHRAGRLPEAARGG